MLYDRLRLLVTKGHSQRQNPPPEPGLEGSPHAGPPPWWCSLSPLLVSRCAGALGGKEHPHPCPLSLPSCSSGNTVRDPEPFVGMGTQPPRPPNLPYSGACGHFSSSVQGGRHGQTLPTVQPGGPGTLLGSFALGQHALVGTRVTVTGRRGTSWPEVSWHQFTFLVSDPTGCVTLCESRVVPASVSSSVQWT